MLFCSFKIGVMIAWTGIENFRVGRYDPPPPANDPDDFMVCGKYLTKQIVHCYRQKKFDFTQIFVA